MNYLHPNWMRIVRILEDQGGLMTFEDILAGVNDGVYQSFAEGDTIVITSIRNFPRKKALEIVLAVGTLEEVYRIQPRVVAFAQENNCELLLASVGRDGWFDAKTPGWERVASTYIRRL